MSCRYREWLKHWAGAEIAWLAKENKITALDAFALYILVCYMIDDGVIKTVEEAEKFIKELIEDCRRKGYCRGE